MGTRQKLSIVLLSIMILLLLLTACAPKAAPAAPSAPAPSAPAAKPGAPAAPQAPTREVWEETWENLTNAAKKEGTVVVYTTAGAEVRTALVTEFKKKYGINVETISAKGGQLAQKVLTERRAGLYLADVYMGGTTTIITQLKPERVFDPLEPALILPEVTNPKLWWKGELDWVDKERLVNIAFMAYPSPTIAINTSYVKPEEIKSYKDLLSPKFKGKISLNDPTKAGTGAKLIGVIGLKIMGLDYMRQLAKQEPVIVTDERIQVDWLARGKYPIAIQPDTPPMAEFKKAGVSLMDITPVEGTYVASGHGSVTLPNRAPHPNGAKVFINWLLSKEGQNVYSTSSLQQSGRLDVPTDFLDPIYIRAPGIKYFEAYSEDFVNQQPEHMKVAEEIFGHLMK